MALEGSLRDFDLFSLFNMIKTQGKSGTLVLSKGQEFVKVYFDQGDIVGCDSNQIRMEDRVGAMLVRLGRLSGDELLAMIQKQRQTLKRMGQLLLESGKVSTQDLEDALFSQAMSLMYRTFRWVEGDYRFDSMLPPESEREHFPPIPVDTVLMEAARILDEWPEVQRRLPDNTLPLQRTVKAATLQLDVDRELSQVFDGRGKPMTQGSSGLTHEQETVLLYVNEPISIQGILQITRYDELDTCKYIAELLEMGLLEVSQAFVTSQGAPAWHTEHVAISEAPEPERPSLLFWPLTALLILVPLFTYVAKGRTSLNLGLASFQSAEMDPAVDPFTQERHAYAVKMALPGINGPELARHLGVPLSDKGANLPDYRKMPDPLGSELLGAANQATKTDAK
ncbi:MAG: DUF4388 domain-containing protein [Firmicutes bacterium]|nr:DUF4388 domain-containing protein [Bacillota bacterium]